MLPLLTPNDDVPWFQHHQALSQRVPGVFWPLMWSNFHDEQTWDNGALGLQWLGSHQ